MRKVVLLFASAISVLGISPALGQQGVGIGTTTFSPSSDAVLELRSTCSGFLTPRMTEAQRLAIPAPSMGLLVFQTDNLPGFRYFNGTIWKSFGGDDLGSHVANTKVVLQDNVLANTTGGEGIRISNGGNVGVGPLAAPPTSRLQVAAGDLLISSEAGNAYGLKLQNPAGTFSSTFKSGAQTADIVYTLPVTAPVNDQVLRTDASGVLSWVDRSAGWGLTGNASTNPATMYLGTTDAQPLRIATGGSERLRINAGAAEVGIGMTAAANNTLDITNATTAGRGIRVTANTLTTGTAIATSSNALTTGSGISIASSSTAFTSSNGLANFTLSGNNAANTGTVVKVVNSGTNNSGATLMLTNAGTNASASFRVNDDGTDSDSSPFFISGTGNVGVGNDAPSQKLQVTDGNIELARTGGTAGELRFQGTAAGITSIKAGAQGATNINYTWPVAAPAAGQVLSSNAAGTMSWITPSFGSGSKLELNLTANVTDLDVTGVGDIYLTSSADNYEIRGTVGGVDRQVIRIINRNSANRKVKLKKSVGTQDFIQDLDINRQEGAIIMYDGSEWYVISRH